MSKHEDFEALLLLRHKVKDENLLAHKIAAVRKLPVLGIKGHLKDRPVSTHNHDHVIAFIPVATATEFCAALAATICEPLIGDTEEYNECYAANAITDQGAPLYDAQGVMVGRVIRLRTNLTRGALIRTACKDHGEFFANDSVFNVYLNRNRLSAVDPTAPVDELSGDTAVPNGPGPDVPVGGSKSNGDPVRGQNPV